MPVVKMAVMADVHGQRTNRVLDEPACDSCNRRAEIFQATGDYCLHCWQEEMHPDVSPSGGHIV